MNTELTAEHLRSCGRPRVFHGYCFRVAVLGSPAYPHCSSRARTRAAQTSCPTS